MPAAYPDRLDNGNATEYKVRETGFRGGAGREVPDAAATRGGLRRALRNRLHRLQQRQRGEQREVVVAAAAEGAGRCGSSSPPTPSGTGWRTRASSRRWSRRRGYHIQRFESEDEFAFFAGGHADIVSTGSYETPVLESEADVQTVTIGKYNMAKDIVVVAARQAVELVRRPAQGLQGRRGVLHRLVDRVAGPGQGPGRPDARRELRRPADGAGRLRRGPGPGAEGRPLRRRRRRSTTASRC